MTGCDERVPQARDPKQRAESAPPSWFQSRTFLHGRGGGDALRAQELWARRNPEAAKEKLGRAPPKRRRLDDESPASGGGQCRCVGAWAGARCGEGGEADHSPCEGITTKDACCDYDEAGDPESEIVSCWSPELQRPGWEVCGVAEAGDDCDDGNYCCPDGRRTPLCNVNWWRHVCHEDIGCLNITTDEHCGRAYNACLEGTTCDEFTGDPPECRPTRCGDGICDAQTANEQPSSPCDPLN